MYSFKYGLPRVRKKWLDRSERKQSFEQLLERAASSISYRVLYFYPRSAIDFILDLRLIYYLFSFSCCVVGLTYSPFWFCVGLLDLFRMNESLQDVGKALHANMAQFGFTFLFVLVIIYVYSILGYVVIADSFILADSGFPVRPPLSRTPPPPP